MAYLQIDSLVYREVLGSLARNSRAPLVSEIAAEFGVTNSEARGSFERLAEFHALVLDEGTGEIEMAPPFSVVPTSHVVSDGERQWFASCAWEALGILPLLERDGAIRSTCPDCGDRIELEVAAGETTGGALVHLSVPAREWWADIRFT